MVERVLAKDETGVRFSLSALLRSDYRATQCTAPSLSAGQIVGDIAGDTGDKGHVFVELGYKITSK